MARRRIGGREGERNKKRKKKKLEKEEEKSEAVQAEPDAGVWRLV